MSVTGSPSICLYLSFLHAFDWCRVRHSPGPTWTDFLLSIWMWEKRYSHHLYETSSYSNIFVILTEDRRCLLFRRGRSIPSFYILFHYSCLPCYSFLLSKPTSTSGWWCYSRSSGSRLASWGEEAPTISDRDHWSIVSLCHLQYPQTTRIQSFITVIFSWT